MQTLPIFTMIIFKLPSTSLPLSNPEVLASERENPPITNDDFITMLRTQTILASLRSSSYINWERGSGDVLEEHTTPPFRKPYGDISGLNLLQQWFWILTTHLNCFRGVYKSWYLGISWPIKSHLDEEHAIFYMLPFGDHLSLPLFSQAPVSTNSEGEFRFAIKCHHFFTA